MILQLYSVYDRVALEYGPIFQCKNDAIAIRQYASMMRGYVDEQKGFDSTSDYELYRIASYDTEVGNVVGVQPVRLHCDIVLPEKG